MLIATSFTKFSEKRAVEDSYFRDAVLPEFNKASHHLTAYYT